MRTIINFIFLIGTSLVSSAAMACPNLSGDYTYVGGTREIPVTWNLKVTQQGCTSVLYVTTTPSNPDAMIRDEKTVDGACFVYDLDPTTPGDSCFSYRFEGDALIGETFDRSAEGMPYVRASLLRITRAPNGNLREELYEGNGNDLGKTAAWEYKAK